MNNKRKIRKKKKEEVCLKLKCRKSPGGLVKIEIPIQ
jgi:hypothetical protein